MRKVPVQTSLQSSSFGRLARLAITLSAGAALGVVGSVIVGGIMGAPKHVTARSGQVDEPASTEQLPVGERVVTQPGPPNPMIESARLPVPTPSRSIPGEPLEPLEQQNARVQAEHRAALEAHAREPLDRSWARATEATIEDDLTPLSKSKHFEVDSVDCKSTTCVASLTFPTYEAAREGWPQIMTARNHAGCGTEVTLEGAGDPSQKYQMAVVFDCAQARATRP